jgi:flagellin
MASFSVVTNIASSNAQSNLHATNMGLNRALSRLSSGFRINTSGDDAAGLAVANSYRNDVAIMNQGIRNANDGLSKLQIKDSALANIATILDRMATLATQAASNSSGVDISKLSSEFNTLASEIDREAAVAGMSAASSFSVFVSSESTVSNGGISDTSIGAVTATALGVTTTTFSTTTAAQSVLASVEGAISSLGNVQNKIGTLQNRLNFAISLAQSSVVNTQAAESRIRDANIAEESANMTRFNILSQSGIAALAQANATSSSVLALLR